MHTLLTSVNPVFQALGLSILHSIWQGLLISGLLYLLRAALPQQNARLRYVTAYAALILLFGIFVFTFTAEWQMMQLVQNNRTISLSDTPDTSFSSAYFHFLSADTAQGWRRFLTLYRLEPVQRSLPALSILYALGICFYCSKLILELLRLKPLRKNNQAPDIELRETFRRLCRLTVPGKHATLRISTKINVPLMLGYFKPLILIPPALINHLTLEQTEAILLHELAHLKRNDYLFNIIQSILETFLFFNPSAWILSAIIRNEREHCCDDFVIAHTSRSMPYARALLTLATQRQAILTHSLAAAGPSHTSLFNRIKRIIDMNHSTKRPQKTLATLTVLLLIAAMACFYTAFSQSPRKKAPPAPAYAAAGPVDPPDFGPSGDPQQEQVAKPDNSGRARDEKRNPDEDLTRQAMQQAKQALETARIQIRKIPWDSIGNTISLSLNSINWDSIGNVIDQSLSAIVPGQESPEIIRERSRKAMAESRLQMQEARKQMQQAMGEARKAIEAAKKEVEAKRKELEAGRENRSGAFYYNRKQFHRHFPDSLRSARNIRLNEIHDLRKQIDSLRKSALALATYPGKINSNNTVLDAGLNKMKKEGLIHRGEAFDIKIRKDQLFINGEAQPAAIYQRYRNYLPQGERVDIHGDMDKLSINIWN